MVQEAFLLGVDRGPPKKPQELIPFPNRVIWIVRFLYCLVAMLLAGQTVHFQINAKYTSHIPLYGQSYPYIIPFISL